MSSRWVQWFSDADSTEEIRNYSLAIEEAQQAVAIADTPWFHRLLERLSNEAMSPVSIGRHEEMIASAARSNTLKELRSSLLSDVAKARSFLESSKEP